MPTLTIRNVRPAVVKQIKARAKRNRHSMEQEVRDVLEAQFIDRRTVLDAIEASWKDQTRPTTAQEIKEWIQVGRE